MGHSTNKDQIILIVKQILDEVKEVKEDTKNNNLHLARHSKIITYLQGNVKKIWDDNERRETEEKQDNKNEIKRLKNILVSVIGAIILAALGINNIPEALEKLKGLL